MNPLCQAITAVIDPIDVHTPSPARIYDVWLGGKDNFAVDREVAAKVEEHVPNVRDLAQENRAFLRRAVTYLAGDCGIRQFIDIGSGLPSQGNVHEVAQQIAPETRVLYVDNDPIVLTHGRALLASNDRTAIITADLRNPNSILKNPEVTRLIDRDEPMAVLMVASLHFIPDEAKPYDIVRRFRQWMPIGSYLAISHTDRTAQLESAAMVYAAATAPAAPRSHGEVRRFFGDFRLVDEGLVRLPAWHPDGGIVRRVDVPIWGGVGHKRQMEPSHG